MKYISHMMPILFASVKESLSALILIYAFLIPYGVIIVLIDLILVL